MPNFDAATIRRTAAALGHRTEASARFEKSLDPELTVLAIAPFICLGEPPFPELLLLAWIADRSATCTDSASIVMLPASPAPSVPALV